MGLTKISHEIKENAPTTVQNFSWQRTAAAGSLVAGACLFLAGRRKTALVLAAAGATVGLLENPEAAKELWESLPHYLRKGQDLLVRIEDFVNEVAKQGSKLRNAIS
ncbi:hypothetical protein [Pseudacidobacterium ailaaui]|jgi:hypothetical protein|uniref:hypothetical protein n=1 Tax=Pseudacidobacterium ailaaui TaxID=1382359 RepID=UPI00047C038D|nr:hypothetical protein [Pseudacidobacterium ailaaui]